jgi:hypothetical protein
MKVDLEVEDISQELYALLVLAFRKKAVKLDIDTVDYFIDWKVSCTAVLEE